jgi:hypothetical protein
MPYLHAPSHAWQGSKVLICLHHKDNCQMPATIRATHSNRRRYLAAPMSLTRDRLAAVTANIEKGMCQIGDPGRYPGVPTVRTDQPSLPQSPPRLSAGRSCWWCFVRIVHEATTNQAGSAAVPGAAAFHSEFSPHLIRSRFGARCSCFSGCRFCGRRGSCRLTARYLIRLWRRHVHSP